MFDYPVRLPDFAATLGKVLIVIPHPDDEALGCGGLLALLRANGQSVYAVLVSDGSFSHPRSRVFSAEARRAVREGELRHALALLGCHEEPLWLRLPDGRVPQATGEAGFAEAVQQLRDFVAAKKPATVLLPWRRDPHPDHRASYAIAQAALSGFSPAPRQLEYVVWAWQRAAPADLPQPDDQVQGFRLAIDPVLPQKQQAIAAHRSQVAPGVFFDDPEGFLLAPDMLEKFAQPVEVYFEKAEDDQK